MPIWTQEQLFEIVVSNYKSIKESEGKTQQEQLDIALKQTETMETWLLPELRNELDEMFQR
jgi:hypothetical protein